MATDNCVWINIRRDNMKRTIIVLLTMLLLVMLTGCGKSANKQSVQAYEIKHDISNSMWKSEYPPLNDMTDRDYVDDSAEKQITLSFLDEEYSLTYTRSYYSLIGFGQVDEYQEYRDGDWIFFTISHDTRNVISYDKNSNNYDWNIPRKELVDMSEKIAKKLLVTDDCIDEVKDTERFVGHIYTQKYKDFDTNFEISVLMDTYTDGIGSINIQGMGLIPDETDIEGAQKLSEIEKKYDEVVRDKIKKMYPNKSENFDYITKKLCKFYNGEYGIECILKNIENDEEMVHLLVTAYEG